MSRVPEVTVWFWVIKILCTTVGESLADWINVGLGVGLTYTAVLFTVALAAVLGVQLAMRRYVPAVYWLTVVVLSVAGTLYTDILTDSRGVPLAASTVTFAVALCAVFAIWYFRERTLSIHSITTLPREAFYWLAVLVTFALGTAVGDWTLELTGWSPGVSVLLPAALIAAIALGWRWGANPVLSFWLAYVLTRPLGANLGDYLASARADHGLGLGYGITSVIFLVVIVAAVGYLTVSRVDVIAETDAAPQRGGAPARGREHVMLAYYAGVAAIAVSVLGWAAAQPHAAPQEETADASSSPTSTLSPGQAMAHFPSALVAQFRVITSDTLASVQNNNQAAARSRITDLETSWDAEQSALQPLDTASWNVLDGQIDAVLSAVRAKTPDPAAETQALRTLLTSLS